MKACIIFNPSARGEKAHRFREHLGTLSSACMLKPTYAAGSGRALAAEAVREGYETLIAAGGDGTVNEVLNGIGDVPGGFARITLGVLPLGTVNVFAREIKMPRQLAAAWQVLLRGRQTVIDLAAADFTRDGQPQRRYFLQMAGAGWDSRAIELVSWNLKKQLGFMAYVVAGLQAWRGALPRIRVCAEEGECCDGQLVLLGNGRLYGGDWQLFPLADMRDGLLEVTVFPRLDLTGVGRGTLGLLLGRLYSIGGAKHFRVRSVELNSAVPVAFHLEGDNVGMLPARFSIESGLLRVIVP